MLIYHTDCTISLVSFSQQSYIYIYNIYIYISKEYVKWLYDIIVLVRLCLVCSSITTTPVMLLLDGFLCQQVDNGPNLRALCACRSLKIVLDFNGEKIPADLNTLTAVSNFKHGNNKLYNEKYKRYSFCYWWQIVLGRRMSWIFFIEYSKLIITLTYRFTIHHNHRRFVLI